MPFFLYYCLSFLALPISRFSSNNERFSSIIANNIITMRNRVIIENVKPEIDNGLFFIKRIPGEHVAVSADIFSDGHDVLRAVLCYRYEKDKGWTETPMLETSNDDWGAQFTVAKEGFYEYKIEAWVDHLSTWHKGFVKKQEDGQELSVELKIGAELLRKAVAALPKAKAEKALKLAKALEGKYDEAVAAVLTEPFAEAVQEFPLRQFQTTYDNKLRVRVGRPKELFSAWYELFPRSTSLIEGRHGTFKDCIRHLPRIQELGFDVLYLPPIHPIGKLNRKGINNATVAEAGDPGSPWAIGSDEGGHKSIAPELGTLEDYKKLIREAAKHGLEVAFDLAFQCAPDHPYIKEHPEWFLWRPDGSIMYAENPPKKYQDIVPLNFETDDWENLWNELKSIVLYWVEQGVTIFRVDNPHTKPFRFWEWLIGEVQREHPEVLFLAEAFTRPKVMAELAKGGFTQSYSYFTWRTTKKEMEEYITELTQTESREYFRPNFWPNTPDILPYELMGANVNAFVKRLIMAGTLSSNYGLYGPSYEFNENSGNTNGKEEYQNSEKYELRHYDWDARNRMTEMMTKINAIRRENPALQTTWNTQFTRTDSDHLMSYVKTTEDLGNIIWCIVNFDTQYSQSGFVEVPKALLGITGRVNLKVTDLISGESYRWFNDWNYVEINPYKCPAHIFKVEL